MGPPFAAEVSQLGYSALEPSQMLFRARTLDDTLRDIMRRLLRNGERILPGKGRAREFTGVLVELSNPRSRISSTEGRGVLISFLGETPVVSIGPDTE